MALNDDDFRDMLFRGDSSATRGDVTTLLEIYVNHIGSDF